MKTPAPPPAPDPVKTAEAQKGLNRETAVTEFNLNAYDQNGPNGRRSWKQTGTWADGTPRYEVTDSLSPEQQKLYEQQTSIGAGTNKLALDQIGRLQDLLGKPINMNNEATESRLMELGRKRLDPMLTDRRNALETKLYNQGVMPGTEAFTRAMSENGQSENDAYTQLLLGGRGQAIQEALTERNQPINEITALMSGGQVSQPQFAGAGHVGVGGVDYGGMVNNKYQGDLAAWNAQQQSKSAMLGGLFGMGGQLLGGWARGGFGGFGK